MTMSVATSVSTVGSKKLPPCAARLPPVTILAPFLTASAMCASTFLDRPHVDQRPDRGARLEPVGDLHRPGGLAEYLVKASSASSKPRTWVAMGDPLISYRIEKRRRIGVGDLRTSTP
jgi:hypothetical protein